MRTVFVLQLIAVSFVFNILTADIADAVTAYVRTSDWVIDQNSLYNVIYWSDYNSVYGTTYYTVRVGT